MRCTLETGGVGGISADLAVNFDQALRDNSGNLTPSQSVLQPVTEEDVEGETLPELVWSRARAGGL